MNDGLVRYSGPVSHWVSEDSSYLGRIFYYPEGDLPSIVDEVFRGHIFTGDEMQNWLRQNLPQARLGN